MNPDGEGVGNRPDPPVLLLDVTNQKDTRMKISTLTILAICCTFVASALAGESYEDKQRREMKERYPYADSVDTFDISPSDRAPYNRFKSSLTGVDRERATRDMHREMELGDDYNCIVHDRLSNC